MPTYPRAHRRSPLFAIPLGLSALLLAGCGGGVVEAAAPSASGDIVTIENCGRTLTLDGVPRAAVGMHPAQTELMLRLGLEDLLVGQAQAMAQSLPSDVAAQAEDIPVIGGVMPPSREDLLSAQPDFVFSPTTYEFSADQGFASVDQLTEAGAEVYVASGGCQDRRMTGEVADLFTDLENLGQIFDVESEAAALAAETRAILDDVAEATASVDEVRVAQVYVEGNAIQAIGAGVEYDILQLAGADNVYAPDQELFSDFFAATISPESLAEAAPEALVISPYDEANEAMMRDYLTQTFPDMPAVRDGRIIAIPSSDMFPGTLGNVSAVRFLAEQLYPDAF
ncbi:ABC transporter substrate-binding protein [Microbacterium sp. ABRD28]|uniref:ABC transporter substrate-binding protein n=1 Tax=Microbacterium sp. ABRD28 TaxID=2268461 RepID=UPI000F550B99|nr:ABC transporter substrate-binding protein [Microbacterium sp. ABRD28]AZC12388.1 zinc ABC transporter substrate-binding protein [Microbacterium sp. ABRD28]